MAQVSEIAAAFFRQEERFCNYFIIWPSRFLQRAEKHSAIPQSSFHNMIQHRLQVALYKLNVWKQLENHD